MQLSEKPKVFCLIFIAFCILLHFLLQSKLNFERFEKKRNQPHILSIFEVTDSERHAYLNASKIFLLKTLWQ